MVQVTIQESDKIVGRIIAYNVGPTADADTVRLRRNYQIVYIPYNGDDPLVREIVHDEAEDVLTLLEKALEAIRK